MTQGSFTANLARHLVSALEPIADGFASVESFQRLLWELGWAVDSIPPSYTAIGTEAASLISSVEALAESSDPGEFATLLEPLIGFLRRIEGLSEAPPGVDVSELGQRLVEFIVVRYLARELPRTYSILQMLGVITTHYFDERGGRPAHSRTELRLTELVAVLRDPTSILGRVYGWGTHSFNAQLLFSHLTWLLHAARSVVTVGQDERGAKYFGAESSSFLSVRFLDWAVGNEVHSLGLSLRPLPAGSALPGLIVQPLVPEVPSPEIAINRDWGVSIEAVTNIGEETGIEIRPGSVELRYPGRAGSIPPSAELRIIASFTPENEAILLGAADQTRLTMAGSRLGLSLGADAGVPGISIESELIDLRAVLALESLDGFVKSLAGGSQLEVTLPARLAWSSQNGLDFLVGAGIRIDARPDISLGPLTITDLAAELAAEVGSGSSPAINARATLGLRAELGPLLVSVEGLGVEAGLTFGGSAAGIDATDRFLPPTGVGLRIDAEPVRGGGYIAFDHENGRYRGAFELAIYELRVAALGLLETRLPQPGPDFSLVILIAAEFPGLQLGFGLSLNGISGLLGVHRTIDPDELRSAAASGSVGTLLAPEDPVGNALAVLESLGRFFPVRADHHVIGIGIQLRWIELVRFDVGVLIEMPGPARIVILGSARAEIAAEDKVLLRIRIDLLGIVDFERKELSLDAMLIDSSILELLDITGGVALRSSWGASPYVLLSIGGFHPDFVPEPIIVPLPVRVGMSMGAPDDFFYLRLEGYFAVTPNTLQFGAGVEIRVAAGPLEAEGALGFDALIQFDPFYFIFEFHARFRIAISGFTLAGASVEGALSGPGPITFRGEVCIELLFFEICWSGTIEIGSAVDQPVPTISSALDVVQAELSDDNLTFESYRTAGALVDFSGAPIQIFDPSSQVVWTQSRVPLGLVVELVEGAPLVAPQQVTISGASEEALVDEWFAPASFANFTDSEAVNLPSFQRLPGGIRLGSASEDRGDLVSHTLAAEQVVLPETVSILVRPVDLPLWLIASGSQPPVPAVSLRREPWTLVGEGGREEAVAEGESVAQHRARASDKIAVPAGDTLPSFGSF